MRISEDTWDGVQTFLDLYVQPQAGDHFVALHTPETSEAAAWVLAALHQRSLPTTRAHMSPLTDPGLADRLSGCLPAPASVIGRLVMLVFEADTVSHSKVIRDALRAFHPQRQAVVRLMSAYEELFLGPAKASPDELSARNASLLHRLTRARGLRIQAPGGTDLQVSLDSERFQWISNRGRLRAGNTVILPAGEVATYPSSVEGTLVADFAWNLNLNQDMDTRLDRSPVTIELQGARAVDIACRDDSILAFMEKNFSDDRARRVGELGFGTNPWVREPIARNSHINERCPGVHLGFGQHNQTGRVPYNCDLHLDLIAKGGLVWIDDDPNPLDLADVSIEDVEHSDQWQEEDVFSEAGTVREDDCCGRVL